jgi:hypothetical protein
MELYLSLHDFIRLNMEEADFYLTLTAVGRRKLVKIGQIYH